MPAACRRVLKLHGCVTDPPSIVLTRGDYMRYDDDRRALRGLMHQNLLERELLVLGFSMTDDNVHLIVDEVRKVLAFHEEGRETGSKGSNISKGFSMGTVVSLVENAMFRKLWDQDFTVLACVDGEQGGSVASPEWMHDCWLDCLQSLIIIKQAASSFVLDPSYDALLTDPQRIIKRALAPVHALMTDKQSNEARIARSCPTWKRIEELLRELGAPDVASGRERYEEY